MIAFCKLLRVGHRWRPTGEGTGDVVTLRCERCGAVEEVAGDTVFNAKVAAHARESELTDYRR